MSLASPSLFGEGAGGRGKKIRPHPRPLPIPIAIGRGWEPKFVGLLVDAEAKNQKHNTTNPRSLASPSLFGEGAGGRGKKIRPHEPKFVGLLVDAEGKNQKQNNHKSQEPRLPLSFWRGGRGVRQKNKTPALPQIGEGLRPGKKQN